MIEVDSDHRLHSPTQTLLTSFHQVASIEETTVKSGPLLSDFSNELVVRKLNPTTLDHLITELTHKPNIGGFAGETDVVDLAEDRGNFIHIFIILRSETLWALSRASS